MILRCIVDVNFLIIIYKIYYNGSLIFNLLFGVLNIICVFLEYVGLYVCVFYNVYGRGEKMFLNVFFVGEFIVFLFL